MKPKPRRQNLTAEKPEPEQEREPEPLFKNDVDICHQLMSRYSGSTAPHHRHLLATAAAIRSILSAESLPLTAPAYFAAAIRNLSDPGALDDAAVSAVLSLVAIVAPLIPEEGISAEDAAEAVGVLVGVAERRDGGLGPASLKGVVKCLGVLILGFCDLGDWDSVKVCFESLLKFSVDKRPKVRRSAQECLQKAFKSFSSSSVIKKASKLILLLVEGNMPVAVKLVELRTLDESTDDLSSKPENVEVLHMLNLLKLTVPYLSAKISSKVLSGLLELMPAKFSPLTRQIFGSIEAFLETSREEIILPLAENIIDSLSSYMTLGEKNPIDTVISAASLLRVALDRLYAGGSSLWMRNFPKVCGSIAGLLTCEAGTASQASEIIIKMINHHMDQNILLTDENKLEDFSQDSEEALMIKLTCIVFENTLSSYNGIPNEHFMGVVSALFLKLGVISFIFMKNILLKLADLMNHSNRDTLDTSHLQNCIGSAVVAMGPERILALIPISIHPDDFSCSNIWLVPILKDHIVGASLQYYLEHIVTLAKSFQRASLKVKDSVTGQELQAHAHGLWGLLPAFCHYPVDTGSSVRSLAEFLIRFLKKETFMHQNISVALKVLVNQNKISNTQNNSCESSGNAAKDSLLDFRSLPYTKKIANRNMKALATCSTELLLAIVELFVDSPSEKRLYLKDVIECLASISDSSITKKIFMSLLERFGIVNGGGEFDMCRSDDDESIDKEKGNLSLSSRDMDVKRCVIMELASSLIEGATEDLIDLIYNFVVYIFKGNDVKCHCEAYYTLSRILEEHSYFCSPKLLELMDLLVGLKPPTDVTSLRNRFSCFHFLTVQTLQMSSEEENTKAFHILNEIIITLKDVKDEVRKVAYDTLLIICSSLRNSSNFSSGDSYHKLLSMIMGYLSGSSPHIKSGAVSALSLLVYNDVDICFKMPDLVSSLLSLLQSKAVEVVKAVLGFVKVLVSCLQAKDLQNLLSDIVDSILPWSSVSRFHFRSKVTIILEIMIRKCGSAAVNFVTPEKYKGFVKTVLQNRHHKSTSKEGREGSSTKRPEINNNKVINSDENGSPHHRKRKREKKQNERSNISRDNHDNGGGGFEASKRARHPKHESSRKNQSKYMKRRTSENEVASGEDKTRTKQRNMRNKGQVPFRRPSSSPKFHKGKRYVKKS